MWLLLFTGLICTPYQGLYIGTWQPVCMRVQSEAVSEDFVQQLIDNAYERSLFRF